MIDIEALPTERGSYALHLRLARSRVLQIGRLGRFTFPAGEYIYVGSALGAGGLRSRVGRHLRGDGKLALAHRLSAGKVPCGQLLLHGIG